MYFKELCRVLGPMEADIYYFKKVKGDFYLNHYQILIQPKNILLTKTRQVSRLEDAS